MTKTAAGLVEFAKKYVGNPYWYGTFVMPCTQSLLNSKMSQYPAHYTAARMARYKDDIAKNKICSDCVGLIKGYGWMDENDAIKYASNGVPDQSANGMYTAAKEKGTIASMPDIPGLAVRFDGHIGVYIGNGDVVEARGFDFGIVITKLTGRPWTHWLKVPWIDYNASNAPGAGTPEKESYPLGFGARILKKGSTGEDVKCLQRVLIGLGHDCGPYGADGDFGNATRSAVVAFQKSKELKQDGEVGQLTRVALEKEWPDYCETDDNDEPDPELNEKLIVDVSQYNNLISDKNDWTVIARNVGLLILRCGVTRTQTSPLGIGIDDHFTYAASKCIENKIPFGVYYYGKVGTVAEARAEADKCWETASPFKPLFYVYDIEEAIITNKVIEAWIDQIVKRGAKKIGAYIAHHMYNNYLASVPFFDFIWLPRYGKNTGSFDPQYAPNYPCDLHQFTDVGQVPGFESKTLDLNRLTGREDFAWFKARTI